ncbi:3-isopropylmalate dehydratase large subunit [Dinoroseobacter sp. PD6]|uniref:3-isopropylmalate dehydratase large subunit n=1 Tax=Dinoroseobacter sp. PD6 TaxID=3028384 RepID=UPI00237AA16D|nr:3-isopropylmalate dehydratase large subunit [Dinoroseobacter sp. PD6]MDD9718302.1 3-isopropylmalate dehydratase large subunit [Dinoroseobacter sp. PD6]
MSTPRTLLEKLWTAHEVTRREDAASLLWVDRHLLHEGSHHAFAKLAERGLSVAAPAQTFAVMDHYAPTRDRAAEGATPEIRAMIARLRENAEVHQIRLFDLFDRDQGIVHVIGPEQGLTLPGLTINCGDSHTSTHGAFGALAFGIGATEVAHVLATQTIWQTRPKTLRLRFDGRLGPGVGAKDMALAWIAALGADGARGHAIEYTGEAVRRLSMEGRMTLCNLSIEGGAKLGLIAPDETTFAYLRGRPHAPDGADWDRAVEDWAALRSDEDAVFDREETLDCAAIAPVVTWGTRPDQAIPVTENLPRGEGSEVNSALTYMGLRAGAPIAGTPVDQVFIGSCTNGRIEDLRAAAAVLAGRRARVPGQVTPGSARIKAQAEQEGLAEIFIAAGLEWTEAGCAMCVGMNGDLVAPGKRCASSTNRNFRGRQGPGARTHLMSPAMVAAAAVTGEITDVRPLLAGRAVA